MGVTKDLPGLVDKNGVEAVGDGALCVLVEEDQAKFADPVDLVFVEPCRATEFDVLGTKLIVDFLPSDLQ